MSDDRNRLEIIPADNPYMPCSSFVCDQNSPTKYVVGNRYSGALFTYPVFCEKCIKHMLANVPTELNPTAADIEDKLRADLTVQYNDVLAQKVADHENAVRQQADMYIAQRLADAQSPFGEMPLEVEQEAETEEEKQIYRCLDCGEEFENGPDLEAHKKYHAPGAPAPEKNKGGRPKKAASK